MQTCERNGNRSHCYHATNPSGVWMSITPPPMVCCHCGKTPEQEHGPFLPRTYTSPSITVSPSVYVPNIGAGTTVSPVPTTPRILLDGANISGNTGTVWKKITLGPTKKITTDKPKKKKK